MSLDLLKPKIYFKLPARSISLCEETVIEIEELENSGNRDLTFIAWAIVDPTQYTPKVLYNLNRLVANANSQIL